MRALDLAQVAATAERLRLERFVRRQVIRAGLAGGAVLFALAAFAMFNFVAYVFLVLLVSPWIAALIVFAIDLVVAGVLVLVAIKSTPGQIEVEALTVRWQALAELEPALDILSLVRETGGLVLSIRRALRGQKVDRMMLLADLASRFVQRRRLSSRLPLQLPEP